MTPDELLDRMAALRVHVRDGRRAPNKPVTLLWALSRVVDPGAFRLAKFKDAEPELRDMLDAFGAADSTVSYAFWRLQNDGLWDVVSDGDLPRRSNDREPTITALRAHASGGFSVPVHDLLVGDGRLRDRAVDLLVARYLGGAAVPVGEPGPTSPGGDVARVTVERILRDRRFRSEVLSRYEGRCVICGWGPRTVSGPVGVEAAHVRALAAGGPDTPDNGIALCAIHHAAFDAGLLAVNDDLRVLVAVDAVDGPWGALPSLADFHGVQLPVPVPPAVAVPAAGWAWHREHVFRG